MRLELFNFLSEKVQAALELPDDAKIINITDEFKDGGPIVVSYSLPLTAEQKEKYRRQRQAAIDSAIDALLVAEK